MNKILFPAPILNDLQEIARLGRSFGLISGWQQAAAKVACLDHLEYWAGTPDGVGACQIILPLDRNWVASIIRGSMDYDRGQNPHGPKALDLARREAPLAEIIPALLKAQQWWAENNA